MFPFGSIKYSCFGRSGRTCRFLLSCFRGVRFLRASLGASPHAAEAFAIQAPAFLLDPRNSIFANLSKSSSCSRVSLSILPVSAILRIVTPKS